MRGKNKPRRDDYLRDCDICGFTYWRSALKKTWDGFIVCSTDYEPKHPQDKIRPSIKTKTFVRD